MGSETNAKDRRSVAGNEMNPTDKRSVATDALDTLGTCPIPEGSARDAIHLAVEPVVAGEELYAGDQVYILGGKAFASRYDATKKAVGIVDPFIESGVGVGDKFWLVLFPRQITSLRHVWSHPDFPEEEGEPQAVENKDPSVVWMENYATSLGVGYAELMRAAHDYMDHGEYFIKGGRFDGISVDPLFWSHYSAITGAPTFGDTSSFFSCSC